MSAAEELHNRGVRIEELRAQNAELVAALEGVVNDVQAWCDAVERGTGWDDWDHYYKNFAYRGGLVRARAALAAAGQPQGSGK